jgi:RNA recognition motif-containing protein
LLNVWWGVIRFIPEGLRNYFSEFGKVDACTIVRDADGKSRGFAFLTFEDPASVNAVMVREHFLDGKAVRVLPPSTSLTFLTLSRSKTDRS